MSASGQKRTSARRSAMSAKCHKLTHAAQRIGVHRTVHRRGAFKSIRRLEDFDLGARQRRCAGRRWLGSRRAATNRETRVAAYRFKLRRQISMSPSTGLAFVEPRSGNDLRFVALICAFLARKSPRRSAASCAAIAEANKATHRRGSDSHRGTSDQLARLHDEQVSKRIALGGGDAGGWHSRAGWPG
jgi:hypothetical protein